MGEKGFSTIVWMLLLVLACALAAVGWFVWQSAGKTTFTLLTSDGKPIANTVVDVYSDTGIRCIAGPCPETNAKEWSGKTNAQGIIKVPSENIQSHTTIAPEGYDGAVLGKDSAKTARELKFDLTPPIRY